MLLYLSSYMFGSDFSCFADKVGTSRRAAVIANALDQYADEARSHRVKEEIGKLNERGFEAEELDLRSYFESKAEISLDLDKFDALWVYGGNSSVLKRAFEQSGLSECLPGKLQSCSLAYGGFSAALVPVMTTLAGLDLCDDPTVLPAEYKPDFEAEGLGLVDRVVVPHYRSKHRESAAIEIYIRFLDDNAIPYITLRDGEALLVDGKDSSIVGSPDT